MFKISDVVTESKKWSRWQNTLKWNTTDCRCSPKIFSASNSIPFKKVSIIFHKSLGLKELRLCPFSWQLPALACAHKANVTVIIPKRMASLYGLSLNLHAGQCFPVRYFCNLSSQKMWVFLVGWWKLMLKKHSSWRRVCHVCRPSSHHFLVRLRIRECLVNFWLRINSV